jgi:hypothetical protein
MEALLNELRSETNPIVLAGDLNTTGIDATPTSVRREVVKRVSSVRFWVGQVIAQFTPGQFTRYGLIPLNYFKNYKDPTASSIPFLAPNREAAFFEMIEDFRFDDGKAFDFRGKGKLGNSNKRAWKGFKPSFRFGRTYRGVGEYKLDWILVKPLITHPRRSAQSFRLAPHNPETMKELSRLISDGVSDHAPLTVDLPLQEPR